MCDLSINVIAATEMLGTHHFSTTTFRPLIINSQKITENYKVTTYKRHERMYGTVKKPIFEVYPLLKAKLMEDNGDNKFRIRYMDFPLHEANWITQPSELDTVFGHPYARSTIDFYVGQDLLCDIKQQLSSLPSITDPNNFEGGWVDEEWKLDEMIVDISLARIVFVHLEVNEYRSYRGKVSLLAFRVGDKFYFVDVLKLDDDIQKLQKIFLNINIIKVVFDAVKFCKHIEKEFYLYLVGVLDVKYLLQQVNVEFNFDTLERSIGYFFGKIQYNSIIADYRVRPLHFAQLARVYELVNHLPKLLNVAIQHISLGTLQNLISLLNILCEEARYIKPVFVLPNFTKTNLQLAYLFTARDAIGRLTDVNPIMLCSDLTLTKLACGAQVSLMNVNNKLCKRYLSYVKLMKNGVSPFPKLQTEFLELGIQFPNYMAVLHECLPLRIVRLPTRKINSLK